MEDNNPKKKRKVDPIFIGMMTFLSLIINRLIPNENNMLVGILFFVATVFYLGVFYYEKRG